jgi:pimeloyl-ACP methyl ester carboxylesterase
VRNDEGVVELRDGRTLGWAEFGEPGGRVVLWFHGTPGGRRQVPPDAPAQAASRGMRIIGVERPGTGRSTAHRYDRVRDWSRDIRDLADALELDRFAVAGLSGGGPYALACAHDLPDRVVAAAVLGGVGPVRGRDAVRSYTKLLAFAEPALNVLTAPLAAALPRLLRPLIPMGPQAIGLYARLAPASDRPVLRHPEFKAMFIDDISNALREDLRGPVYDLVLFARDWGFSLRDVQVPVHFWQGDADGVVPPNHCPHQAELVPHGSITMVPAEGHFAGFTNLASVLDVLDGCWEEATA